MTEVSEDSVTKIEKSIDTSGTYGDIQTQLQKKYPKWNEKQRKLFAREIVSKKAFMKKDHLVSKIKDEHLTISKQYGKSTKLVYRNDKGQYIGRKENIKITTRRGDTLYYKNIRTGKKGTMTKKKDK